MTRRVLLAGLFHETHTFLQGTTTLAEFQIRRDEELLSARGDGSPLAGCLGVADARGWQMLPTIDYRATPSATVADEVVEQFWREFVSRAAPELARGVDGIYLVLHGAMASENFPDVEGEILARLRNLPGAQQLPVAGVLDLHGNISQRMASHADCLVAYRENPHTDAHESAGRGATFLHELMESGKRAVTVWKHSRVMWPPTGVATSVDPMRSLERMAREIEERHSEIMAVNVFGGYSFADTPDTGVSFTAITRGDPVLAAKQLEPLADWTVQNRELGYRPDEPLEAVLPKLRNHVQGPILLVEPSDNIGGGAPGDGTGILRALVAQNIDQSAVVINDPEAVRALAGRQPGSRMRLPLGGKGSDFDAGPLELEVELVSTSGGRFDLEDRQSHLASMCGTRIEMGPCAVVRHAGVTILLTSHKTPPFDLGQWRSQGIHPEALRVIGVKAAVAHRRAYDPIAKASYTVDTPGPCSSNLRHFRFQRITRPTYPLDDLN